MKLINKNKNTYTHTLNGKTYVLSANSTIDVPKEIADIWLKIEGVEKFIAPEDLKKAQAQAESKAKAEIEELKKELQALKTENEDLKKAQAQAKEN